MTWPAVRRASGRIGVLIATVALCLAGWVPTAAAQAMRGPAVSPQDDGGGISWAVQPSSEDGPNGRDAFRYTLEPGQSVTDYVGVSNFGSTPLTLRVYPMDAETTRDGAFTVPPAGTENKDVGAWIGLTGGGTYTVEAGQRLDIPFRLAVPKTASPGDHAGGIVASPVQPSVESNGGQQVIVDRRVGARIYLTVPGVRNPQLSVSDVDVDYAGGWHPTAGTATVSYTVTNSGNVRLAGTSDLTLNGIDGWRLGSVRGHTVPEILPGSAIRVTETLENIFPAGQLTAAVTVHPVSVGDAGDDVGDDAHATGQSLALPYLIICVLAALLLLVIVLIVRRRRRRRRARSAPATRTGPADGTSDDSASESSPGEAHQPRSDTVGEPVPVGAREPANSDQGSDRPGADRG